MSANNDNQREAAVNTIRRKLDVLYAEEPGAKAEIDDIEKQKHQNLSKHQRYLDELTKSGRSLAEIQTAWHEYYVELPDHEKHEVWHEFYAKHAQSKADFRAKRGHKAEPLPVKHPPRQHQTQSHADNKSVQETKERVLKKAAKRDRLRGKPHLQSLLFGLGVGSALLVILLFGFFNERFVTPFIRPSHAISTPIITDPNANSKVGPQSKIIIPKINLEAPVVYDEPSINEKAIQNALERGVVHYATTPDPGEKGNSVIVGHSSSNILNRGKYKFAFLLLKSLDKGDTFIIHKDKQRYVYKVYKEFVTGPEDVSVLGPTDKTSTVTLITCDPPGMSTNRLIIIGEQIFPDPAKNKKSQANQASTQKPEILPSNAPSLWQRIIDAL